MEQLEKLIIEPNQHLHAVGPMVIVIDALDESGDQPGRRHLLHTISEKMKNNTLPTHLRFLITARPETDILAALATGPQIVHKQMGDILEDIVHRDIETFIRHLLSDQFTELESFWPDQEWCRLLVHHSQKLFQWASTACNFIQGDGAGGLNLHKWFKLVANANKSKGLQPLDNLYGTIIAQQFTWDEAKSDFQEVMAALFALKEPLSIISLSALFSDQLSVRDVIKHLGSLLDGVVDEEKPIRPLHTSFHDFLLEEARSFTFHVNIQPRHSLCLG